MSRIIKWPLYAIGSLVIFFVLASYVLAFATETSLDKRYTIEPSGIKTSKDPKVIARGEYLAQTIVGCAHCHEKDLSGKELNNDPFVGRIWSDNLTPGAGGVGSHLETEDWVRIIRHGVSKSGHSVNFMPSQSYVNLSKKDLTAIVSYLVSLEPVDERHPKKRIGPVARGMYLAGVLPVVTPAAMIDHAKPFPAYVKPGKNAAYGKYLVDIGGCRDCHGSDLRGRPSLVAPPGTPPAPNITSSGTAKEWDLEKFIKVMNTGVVTKNEKLNTWMPWEYFGKMTDDDLSAVYMYLNTLK